MLTKNQIDAMRTIEKNLISDGQSSRGRCVKKMLDNLESNRLVLIECKDVFGEIYKKAQLGFIDEVLLYSGILEAKLTKILDES